MVLPEAKTVRVVVEVEVSQHPGLEGKMTRLGPEGRRIAGPNALVAKGPQDVESLAGRGAPPGGEKEAPTAHLPPSDPVDLCPKLFA